MVICQVYLSVRCLFPRTRHVHNVIPIFILFLGYWSLLSFSSFQRGKGTLLVLYSIDSKLFILIFRFSNGTFFSLNSFCYCSTGRFLLNQSHLLNFINTFVIHTCHSFNRFVLLHIYALICNCHSM